VSAPGLEQWPCIKHNVMTIDSQYLSSFHFISTFWKGQNKGNVSKIMSWPLTTNSPFFVLLFICLITWPLCTAANIWLTCYHGVRGELNSLFAMDNLISLPASNSFVWPFSIWLSVFDKSGCATIAFGEECLFSLNNYLRFFPPSTMLSVRVRSAVTFRMHSVHL